LIAGTNRLDYRLSIRLGLKHRLGKGLKAMSGRQLTAVPFRERAKEVSGALIEVVSPLLKEVIDYADNIFWLCLEVAESRDREDHAPLVLYRHLIDMTDGIEVLISEGCSSPAEPLLRSCFEAWLSLNYIMTENYEQRSLAWLCTFLHSEIDQKEMLDRGTQKGKKFAITLEKEAPEILQKLRPARDVGELQKALADPHFAEIEAKYQRLKEKRNRKGKRKGGKPPYWCALVGGPNSLPELANSLSRGALYQVFYGPWSILIHGFDASRFLAGLPDGSAAFKLLRDPAMLKEDTCLAEWFVNYATQLMIRKFVPQEAANFIKWLAEINRRLDRLDRFEFKVSELP
jgi:hypothetical protein